jgi:hypothetical protein
LTRIAYSPKPRPNIIAAHIGCVTLRQAFVDHTHEVSLHTDGMLWQEQLTPRSQLAAPSRTPMALKAATDKRKATTIAAATTRANSGAKPTDSTTPPQKK